jgi:peptidoglycan/xylan/chitin deacetylase (PgdA/CDA1 family)
MAAMAALGLGCRAGAPPRAVAVTVDDLPGPAGVLSGIAAHLRAAGAPAWGFACAGRGVEPLRIWMRAGYPIGNHTYSHRAYSRLSIDDYLADVRHNEDVLRERLGVELRGGFFRYPFLDHGHTEEKVEAMVRYLRAHGYRHAPVSLDTVDYRFAAIYRRTGSRDAVAAMYVEHVRESAAHFEALSRRLFGREIPLVLLVHANDLNADRLGDVLKMLAGRGYRFVRLEEALADPAYAAYGLRPPLVPRKGDRSFLNQVSLSRGLRIADPSGDAHFNRYWLPKLGGLP